MDSRELLDASERMLDASADTQRPPHQREECLLTSIAMSLLVIARKE